MNALAALALIANAAPQGTVGPIQPTGPVGMPTYPTLSLVNLVSDPSFERTSAYGPVAWGGSALLTFYAYQWDPPFHGWASATQRGIVDVGRSGVRSMDLSVQPFSWTANETDYTLETFVHQDLATPVSGSAIVAASAWFRGNAQVTATVYYTFGRPTSVTKWVYTDIYAYPDKWTRFDFGEAIAKSRTVTGIRFSTSLPLNYGYGTVSPGYESLLIDDVALLVTK